MADNKISGLPGIGTQTDDDLFETEQPGEAAGTRSRKETRAQIRAYMLDNDPTLAGDSAVKAATQHAVKEFVEDAIADAIAALDPNGASIGVQFLADTSSTSDADPGAGNLRWNHGAQASATVIYLDDATADGASLTAIWPRLNAGGTMFLQHATNQDIWQIWEFTAINDASGYAKLTVTLWGASGSFADNDPMLVTLDKGQGSAATAFAQLMLSDMSTDLTTGTNKGVWFAPENGQLVEVWLALHDPSSSGVVRIDMNDSGGTVFTTRPSIDATEATSLTGTTAVLDGTITFSKGDKFTFDIDDAGTDAKGLQVTVGYTPL